MVFDTVMATKEYLYWNSLVESLIRAGFIPSVNLVTGGYFYSVNTSANTVKI